MKKNYKYFMLVIISFMMATFAACTMDATNTDDPSNPNPPINNNPPIEDIEKRKVTMIKIDREGDEEFYYFNYDQKDRVKRITTVESDTEDSWYYIMDIDYSSQQIIKLTSGNEENGYSDEYISLNDMGYIESYGEDEYTYDANGFIKRITYEGYDSWAETDEYWEADFKWQNGNISRVDQEEDYVWGERRSSSNFTYNTNKNYITTIDLSYFVTYFCSEVWFPSGFGCIGLAGKSSTNYVTSIARKTNDSDGNSELYNVSFKWGYDEDGYPTICLISSEWIYDNQRESVEYTVEISYYDETGEVDPELPHGDTPTTSGDIKLSANKTAIELGETITFTAEQKSDATGEFIDVTKDIALYDNDLNRLTNPFTPTTTGVLSVTAAKGKYVSNTLTITVMAQMPEVPADPEPENLAFNHRVVLIDHTGVGDGYSPAATDQLRNLAKTEWHKHYNEVTCHAGTFSDGDPANSDAANALNQFQNSLHGGSKPVICFNFYSKSNGYGATAMQAVLQEKVNKDGADVGIAMAVEGSNTNIYCAAQVKAKESKEYKVVAWLLESNIYSPNQSCATQDHHKLYNFALRNISGEYSKVNVASESIGVLEEGQTHDCAFTLPIESSKWNWQNMGVLVIVSAKDSNNRWDVVNSAYCSVEDKSKAYEYVE